MFPSPTPRTEAARAQAAELLAGLVLSGLSLALLAQRAHWTVRGPAFGELHKLFGEIYSDVAGLVDRLAERGATLGAEDPMGGATGVSVPALASVDGIALCEALAPALDGFAKDCCAVYGRLNEGGFCADANALQDVIEASERLAWMVRSHTLSA